jgi:transposase-like protein
VCDDLISGGPSVSESELDTLSLPHSSTRSGGPPLKFNGPTDNLPAGRGSENSRNGSSPKKVTTDVGEVALRVPRDRNGTFDPQTVPKHQRRLDGLSGNVISLYAKGMTTGDIQAHLLEIYGTEISRETISKITDQIVEDMAS